MNAAKGIEANEISRLNVARIVVRVIENNYRQEAQRYNNQRWEPLTKNDIGLLILNQRAKVWLNKYCETIVGQYEEDKAEQQYKDKAESIRRASEWDRVADLKFGKLEVRILESQNATERKVQLNNKDKWQDCSEQEVRAMRSLAPFNDLLIQHFDGVAGKSVVGI